MLANETLDISIHKHIKNLRACALNYLLQPELSTKIVKPKDIFKAFLEKFQNNLKIEQLKFTETFGDVDFLTAVNTHLSNEKIRQEFLKNIELCGFILAYLIYYGYCYKVKDFPHIYHYFSQKILQYRQQSAVSIQYDFGRIQEKYKKRAEKEKLSEEEKGFYHYTKTLHLIDEFLEMFEKREKEIKIKSKRTFMFWEPCINDLKKIFKSLKELSFNQSFYYSMFLESKKRKRLIELINILFLAEFGEDKNLSQKREQLIFGLQYLKPKKEEININDLLNKSLLVISSMTSQDCSGKERVEKAAQSVVLLQLLKKQHTEDKLLIARAKETLEHLFYQQHFNCYKIEELLSYYSFDEYISNADALSAVINFDAETKKNFSKALIQYINENELNAYQERTVCQCINLIDIDYSDSNAINELLKLYTTNATISLAVVNVLSSIKYSKESPLLKNETHLTLIDTIITFSNSEDEELKIAAMKILPEFILTPAQTEKVIEVLDSHIKNKNLLVQKTAIQIISSIHVSSADEIKIFNRLLDCIENDRKNYRDNNTTFSNYKMNHFPQVEEVFIAISRLKLPGKFLTEKLSRILLAITNFFSAQDRTGQDYCLFFDNLHLVYFINMAESSMELNIYILDSLSKGKTLFKQIDLSLGLLYCDIMITVINECNKNTLEQNVNFYLLKCGKEVLRIASEAFQSKHQVLSIKFQNRLFDFALNYGYFKMRQKIIDHLLNKFITPFENYSNIGTFKSISDLKEKMTTDELLFTILKMEGIYEQHSQNNVVYLIPLIVDYKLYAARKTEVFMRNYYPSYFRYKKIPENTTEFSEPQVTDYLKIPQDIHHRICSIFATKDYKESHSPQNITLDKNDICMMDVLINDWLLSDPESRIEIQELRDKLITEKTELQEEKEKTRDQLISRSQESYQEEIDLKNKKIEALNQALETVRDPSLERKAQLDSLIYTLKNDDSVVGGVFSRANKILNKF